jgi:hypothetical protein
MSVRTANTPTVRRHAEPNLQIIIRTLPSQVAGGRVVLTPVDRGRRHATINKNRAMDADERRWRRWLGIRGEMFGSAEKIGD